MKAKQIAVVTTCSWLCLYAIASAGQDGGEKRWQSQAERKVTMIFETTEGTNFCQSNVAIEYQQRDDIASVAGKITVNDCTRASGDFIVSIRIRDESGEVQNIEVAETWQRTDNAPYPFARDYPIGKNVDLVRVRARRAHCICDDVDAASENTE